MTLDRWQDKGHALGSARAVEPDRPSWAVMASAVESSYITVGSHRVFWTTHGERFRCTQCGGVKPMEDFEASPECAR